MPRMTNSGGQEKGRNARDRKVEAKQFLGTEVCSGFLSPLMRAFYSVKERKLSQSREPAFPRRFSKRNSIVAQEPGRGRIYLCEYSARS